MQSWWSSSCKYELVLTLWAGHQNNSKFLAAVSSSLYLIWNFTRAISKGSCYFMTLWKNSARIFIGRKGRAHSSCALQSFLVQGDPQYETRMTFLDTWYYWYQLSNMMVVFTLTQVGFLLYDIVDINGFFRLQLLIIYMHFPGIWPWHIIDYLLFL